MIIIFKFSCISFDSYIKPQLSMTTPNCTVCCISFDSYIKPQQGPLPTRSVAVVYLLIPTSNHNAPIKRKQYPLVVYLLIPTSNHNGCPAYVLKYMVVYLLIPTSNHNATLGAVVAIGVVYLLIPTSNHNSCSSAGLCISLYIFWFLHQTTTMIASLSKCLMLYIFWFLHQTTTGISSTLCHTRCISFDSYIKPQHFHYSIFFSEVVYLLIPTSNHNYLETRKFDNELYIFWFLHQTTTLL